MAICPRKSRCARRWNCRSPSTSLRAGSPLRFPGFPVKVGELHAGFLAEASHGAIGECLVAGNPAVFLSVHESIDFIQATEDVGADGYVFKSQIDRDLMKTLHAAA
jgi:hypothetical protein